MRSRICFGRSARRVRSRSAGAGTIGARAYSICCDKRFLKRPFPRRSAMAPSSGRLTDLLAHRQDPHAMVEEIIAALMPPTRGANRASMLTEPWVQDSSSGHRRGIALTRPCRCLKNCWDNHPKRKKALRTRKYVWLIFSLGESRLELLEGTAADSPIARFIAKAGRESIIWRLPFLICTKRCESWRATAFV